MKKIIIAALVSCGALVVSAATANWKTTASNLFDGSGSNETTAKYSGTAYLFDAGAMSQTALYAIICAGTAIDSSTSGYVATLTATSGAITQTNYSYGEQSASASDLNNYTYYFVIVEDDKAYFSNEKTLSANATDTAKSVPFGSQNSTTTFSSLAPTGSGFAGAGYWSAVPEPTSGLLLLLGVAGLALKRKRA